MKLKSLNKMMLFCLAVCLFLCGCEAENQTRWVQQQTDTLAYEIPNDWAILESQSPIEKSYILEAGDKEGGNAIVNFIVSDSGDFTSREGIENSGFLDLAPEAFHFVQETSNDGLHGVLYQLDSGSYPLYAWFCDQDGTKWVITLMIGPNMDKAQEDVIVSYKKMLESIHNKQ